MERLSVAARRWLAGLASLALLVGCGGREATYPVTGVVRYADGARVPLGTVEFREHTTGRIARGQLGPTGRFQLGTFAPGDGAIPGSYQVIVVQHLLPDQAINPPSHDPPDVSGEDQDEASHGEHEAAHAGRPRLVAAKHADYATSGLVAEVRPVAANEVSLMVEAQEKPPHGGAHP